MNSNNEIIKPNWIAPVKFKKHGRDKVYERTVKTNGIMRIPVNNLMPRIIELMKQGQEVRLTYNGNDAVRFYPTVDCEMKRLHITAQILGETYSDALADIEFVSTRVDGKTTDDIASEIENMKKHGKNSHMVCVTPSTMVTCPQCGCDIRVGKMLIDSNTNS